jgi:HSP20 family protein
MNYRPVARVKNSWRPLSDFHREMDELLDNFWVSPAIKTQTDSSSQWRPACDVEEAEEHFLVTMELAGIPKEEVKLEVVDNQLLISGERQQKIRNKENGQWYTERSYGKFQRTFALPTGINTDQIEANYQDGILRIIVPKAEVAKPKQIKIANGNSSKFFGKLLGSSKKEQEVENSSDVIVTD